MNVLVTGSNGFIGKNLIVHLNELENYDVLTFSRENSIDELKELISHADAIIHLAGENRPKDASAFKIVNTDQNHDHITLKQTLLRYAANLGILLLLGMPLFLIYADSKKLAVNDIFSKTKLISFLDFNLSTLNISTTASN